jgi:hypothetical protein
MSGIYTVRFRAVAVTAAQDLIAVIAHASKQCVLLGFGISQTSDVGDAAEESLAITVESGATVAGSGGSAPTPVATDSSSAAAGFTARANDTTRANTGTIVEHYSHAWNVRVPLDVWLPEPGQIIFGAGRRLVIGLPSAPADSLTVNGYAVVQEIG